MHDGETTLGGVPAFVVGADRLAEPSRPTTAVLWYPGFRADRRTNVDELRTFADAGLVAVGLDAADHGARRPPDFDDRFGPHRSPAEWDRHFGALVEETVAEVPGVVDELLRVPRIKRVAIAGVSMGGIVAYRALAAEPRLRAAVALLATPACPGLDEPPPTAAAFAPRPVLSLVAGLDESVPPDAARRLHAEGGAYRDAPDRLSLVEYPRSGHTMRGEDWWDAITRAAAWMARWC